MQALGDVLRIGLVRTRDLGGTASTLEFADAVCEALNNSQTASLKAHGAQN